MDSHPSAWPAPRRVSARGAPLQLQERAQAGSDARTRLIFDLTSSINWFGPPTGIVRAQRELAAWALESLPGTVFACFDPRSRRYWAINRRHVMAFCMGEAVLDEWSLTAYGEPWERRRSWLAARTRRAFRPRRTAMRALENLRLSTDHPSLAEWADRVQRRLMSAKDQGRMLQADGRRRALLTPKMAWVGPVEFKSSDMLICTGHGWADTDLDAILEAKHRDGFRLAALCYDIIALMHPDLFPEAARRSFDTYWNRVLPAADVLVFNSRAVLRDAAAHADRIGCKLKATMVSPLGMNPSTMAPIDSAKLPPGLESGRYALFVSTIEPRKGHEMLCRIWARLLDEGIPQQRNFKLVFAGRWGWMMEDLRRRLAEDQRLEGSLVVIDRPDDQGLEQLYRHAAFGLYPSLYEGYGLPLVEAFARGKAVLVSDGGALPELAAGLSPILPARDEEAWRAAMKAWIIDPSKPARYERKIRRAFRGTTWSEASRSFFRSLQTAADRQETGRWLDDSDSPLN